MFLFIFDTRTQPTVVQRNLNVITQSAAGICTRELHALIQQGICKQIGNLGEKRDTL